MMRAFMSFLLESADPLLPRILLLLHKQAQRDRPRKGLCELEFNGLEG